MLYVEHDLLPDAFPPTRIQTLAMLSAQIAISIENSAMYAEVSALVAGSFIHESEPVFPNQYDLEHLVGLSSTAVGHPEIEVKRDDTPR